MAGAYRVLLGVGVAAIAAMAALFGADLIKNTVPTAQYAVIVDPIIDRQSLFVVGRVSVQNSGMQELKNVYVDFGAGDTLALGTMGPGQKVILSPPEGNPMEYVIVTADSGVLASKAYRELPKMVGMMGS